MGTVADILWLPRLVVIVSGYSPIDFTLLDPHYGTVDEWRGFVDAVHARNMYVIIDFTVGTMGDLIGWQG